MRKPIDWFKPVQTEDGRAVTIFATEAVGEYPVVGQIAGSDVVLRWRLSGESTMTRCRSLDIKNVPEKRVVYLNMYPNGVPGIHPTRKHADERAQFDRQACVRLEYTEGQFDE